MSQFLKGRAYGWSGMTLCLLFTNAQRAHPDYGTMRSLRNGSSRSCPPVATWAATVSDSSPRRGNWAGSTRSKSYLRCLEPLVLPESVRHPGVRCPWRLPEPVVEACCCLEFWSRVSGASAGWLCSTDVSRALHEKCF
jgi:hypothetical protein